MNSTVVKTARPEVREAAREPSHRRSASEMKLAPPEAFSFTLAGK
jgi:hypothetical protein